jgi:hypothetical protein
MKIPTMTVSEAKAHAKGHAIEALTEKTYPKSKALTVLRKQWTKQGSIGTPLLIEYMDVTKGGRSAKRYLPTRFFETKEYPS